LPTSQATSVRERPLRKQQRHPTTAEAKHSHRNWLPIRQTRSIAQGALPQQEVKPVDIEIGIKIAIEGR